MSKTKENNFSLKKVKFRKDGGLEVDYGKTDVQEGGVVRTTLTEKCSAPAHPELEKITARLRGHFAAIHGLIPTELLTKGFDNLSEKEQIYFQTVIESIGITGVTFIGSDESDQKYIMTAKRQVLAGGYVGMATPKIMQDDNRYDCSDEFTTLMQQLHQEVYAYIVEKKYAQLSFDFDEEEAVSDNKAGLEAV